MTEKRGRPKVPVTLTRQQAVVHAMYELTTEYIGRPIAAPDPQDFPTEPAYEKARRAWETERDRRHLLKRPDPAGTKGTKSTYLPANTAALILESLSTLPAADRLHGEKLSHDLLAQIIPMISRYPEQSQKRILETVVAMSRWVPEKLTISAIKKMYREYHRERGLVG